MVRHRERDERDGFDRIFAEQAPRLYRTALGILGNPHDASDALQETGMRALRYWDGLKHPEAAPAWLTRILLNCCRDVARRRNAATPAGLLQSDLRAPAPPFADLDLLDALGTLPEEQRETVVLRFFQDLTIPEIARVTQVPAGTVKSRLHTAMARLRARLTSSPEEEEVR